MLAAAAVSGCTITHPAASAPTLNPPVAFEETCTEPTSCLPRIAAGIGDPAVGHGLFGPGEGATLVGLSAIRSGTGRWSVSYGLTVGGRHLHVFGVGPATALFVRNNLALGTPTTVRRDRGSWNAGDQTLDWQDGSWLWGVSFGNDTIVSLTDAVRLVGSWKEYAASP